jgi:receptor expression-enhancing protein 5/6
VASLTFGVMGCSAHYSSYPPVLMCCVVMWLSSSAVKRGPAASVSSSSPSSDVNPSSSSSSSLVQLESSLSHLTDWSLLRSVEQATGVPALYLAVVLVVLALLVVFQGWGMKLLTTTIGFIYPLYCSLRSLSSSSSSSSSSSPASVDRLWLIYWMVYGVFTFTERLSDSVLSWLPLYHPLKLMFLLWCFLPRYQGCAVLYDVFLQPLLARHHDRIEKGVEEVTEVIGVVGAHMVRTGRKASVTWMERLKAPSPAHRSNPVSTAADASKGDYS